MPLTQQRSEYIAACFTGSGFNPTNMKKLLLKSPIPVATKFHRFMNSAEIVHALQHQVVQGKQIRR